MFLVCYFFLDKPFVQESVKKSTTRGLGAKYSRLKQSLSDEKTRVSRRNYQRSGSRRHFSSACSFLFSVNTFSIIGNPGAVSLERGELSPSRWTTPGFPTMYLFMPAMVTTLAFPDAPFNQRDHYVAYVMCFSLGYLFGCFYQFCFSLNVTNSKPSLVKQLFLYLYRFQSR